MTPHQFQSPKVSPVKVTSPHRPTKVHQAVPRPDDAEKRPADRPRRDAS